MMRLDRLVIMAMAAMVLGLIGCGGETEPRVEQVDEGGGAQAAPASDESGGNAEADESADAGGDDEGGAFADAEMEDWEGDGIAWATPEPWTTEAGSGLRFATIHHGDDADTAEIAVTRFPGDVGGVMANVNRWCQQVGAPPVSTEEEMAELLTEMEVSGVNALLAEIDGEDDLRLVALILPDDADERTWFFRISGQKEAVEQAEGVLERVRETIELDDVEEG